MVHTYCRELNPMKGVDYERESIAVERGWSHKDNRISRWKSQLNLLLLLSTRLKRMQSFITLSREVLVGRGEEGKLVSGEEFSFVLPFPILLVFIFDL